MMKCLLTPILPIVLMLSGCTNSTHEIAPFGRYGHRFALSENRLTELTQAADRGDGKAAYLIALHYNFALCDTKNGPYWKKRWQQSGYVPKPADAP